MHVGLGLSLVLLGCAGLAGGLIETRRVLRQENWNRIRGRVESGAVVFTGETYAAHVVYNYAVDGVEHKGNIVRSGALQYNWRGPAERVLGRYPPGSDVVVFVDPTNARAAVLEPGGSNFHPVFVGLSAIALIIGVAVLLT